MTQRAIRAEAANDFATRQNLLDGRALAVAQTVVLARGRVASALGHKLGMLPLLGMHRSIVSPSSSIIASGVND